MLLITTALAATVLSLIWIALFDLLVHNQLRCLPVKWEAVRVISMIAVSCGTALFLPEPLDLIPQILVIIGFEAAHSKTLKLNAVIGAMGSIVPLKAISLANLIFAYVILYIFGLSKIRVLWSGIRVLLLAVSSIFLISKLKSKDLSNFCERHALAIEGSFFLMFMLTYWVLHRSYDPKNWLLHAYGVVVIGVLFFAVIMWTAIDQLRQKEKKAHLDEIERRADEVHRYRESVPAYERELYELKRLVEGRKDSLEVADEIDIAIGSIAALRKDMEQKAQTERGLAIKAPATGFPVLNRQLQKEMEQAAALGIVYSCEVFSQADGPMQEIGMPEHLVQQMLGDLYRNAEAAVLLSDNPMKQILLTMGMTTDGYRFCMSDTGAPFPKDKLEHLSELRPTPDGHGHGFRHMIDALRPYGGSIIIERTQLGDCYTKDIIILFDGKGSVETKDLR